MTKATGYRAEREELMNRDRALARERWRKAKRSHRQHGNKGGIKKNRDGEPDREREQK